MPRWKSTQQIIAPQHDGEVFNPNWMDRDTVQMPPSPPWLEQRPPRVDEIDIWEVICEWSGLSGVYAAWCPHAELYIVTDRWRIVAEFSGWAANQRLEQYLIAHNILYPKSPDLPVPEFQRSMIML